MLSLCALERNNNPYIEQIVEPYVFKNQEEIFTTRSWLGKKPWKRARIMKRLSISRKQNWYICVRKRKNINCFEITAIIFKVYKKRKSLDLLTKKSFFLYFRDCTEIGEDNKKQTRHWKYVRTSKRKFIKKDGKTWYSFEIDSWCSFEILQS